MEISFPAVLQDDVPNALVAKVVNPPNDILVGQALHELHLLLCHSRVRLLHGLHLLDRNGLLGGQVLSLVNLSIGPFSCLRKQLVLNTCFLISDYHCKYYYILIESDE